MRASLALSITLVFVISCSTEPRFKLRADMGTEFIVGTEFREIAYVEADNTELRFMAFCLEADNSTGLAFYKDVLMHSLLPLRVRETCDNTADCEGSSLDACLLAFSCDAEL